jgi:glucosamine kinase
MNKKVILGLDGGGTYTRIAITDTEGNLLSYVESKGASSIYKDIKASENVHNAINEAVDKADCSLGDIISLAAGVAGLDHESDLEWARELTRIDGLNCLSRHVNDAVTAHSGAFFSKPGIIAISGTGSNIFGITENGRHISNYNFHHYAATAARFLSYDTVYKIIAGETNQTDDDLVDQVLTYFEAADLSALSKQGSEGFTADKRARDKQFGNLAPVITNAALNGSDLVVVNSGLPWWTGQENAQRPGLRFLRAPYTALLTFGDYILFKGSLANVVAEGRFDNEWKLPAGDRAKIEATGAVVIR